MATSILEQYRISDLVEWFEQKKIRINRKFQRRAVWTPTAKAFLIDTVLRELPIPKIYIRTIVDLKSKKSFREVVDGQQRLRAIVEFSRDQIRLTRKSGEYSGLRYSDLDPEIQERFLSYPVSVGQLINASDDDVLEIFSRLNSYTVKLNSQELRHAQFQGLFKWAVYESSRQLSPLFEAYDVLTARQRLRMLDDQLVAEMYGIILEGVTDGGQNNIHKIYRKFDQEGAFDQEEADEKVLSVSHYIFENFPDLLEEYPSFAKAPHFLMLFAAVAHAFFGIPKGGIDESMPAGENGEIDDIDQAIENLEILAGVIEYEEVPNNLQGFYKAVSSSTQRIASRKARFPAYYSALIDNLE